MPAKKLWHAVTQRKQIGCLKIASHNRDVPRAEQVASHTIIHHLNSSTSLSSFNLFIWVWSDWQSFGLKLHVFFKWQPLLVAWAPSLPSNGIRSCQEYRWSVGRPNGLSRGLKRYAKDLCVKAWKGVRNWRVEVGHSPNRMAPSFALGRRQAPKPFGNVKRFRKHTNCFNKIKSVDSVWFNFGLTWSDCLSSARFCLVQVESLQFDSNVRQVRLVLMQSVGFISWCLSIRDDERSDLSFRESLSRDLSKEICKFADLEMITEFSFRFRLQTEFIWCQNVSSQKLIAPKFFRTFCLKWSCTKTIRKRSPKIFDVKAVYLHFWHLRLSSIRLPIILDFGFLFGSFASARKLLRTCITKFVIQTVEFSKALQFAEQRAFLLNAFGIWILKFADPKALNDSNFEFQSLSWALQEFLSLLKFWLKSFSRLSIIKLLVLSKWLPVGSAGNAALWPFMIAQTVSLPPKSLRFQSAVRNAKLRVRNQED